MDDQKEPDPIPSLITNPFKARVESEKRNILKVDRPIPVLLSVSDGHEIGGGNNNPTFDSTWYEKYPWLAGSSTNNKLYCWPCLLLSKNSNKKKVWTKDGFIDLRSIHVAAESHANSKDHIHNTIELEMISPSPSKLSSVRQKVPLNVKIDPKCEKNRLLIRRLTEVALTLCRTGLALPLLEQDSCNGRQFKTLFSLFISHDEVLKQHCNEMGEVYSKMFSNVLKDIIETVSHEILYFQRDELKKAPFFSIQVDNAIDVADEFLHTIIARYVDENGDLQEQFLGFPLLANKEHERQAATGLYGTLDAVIGHNVYKSKIISQSFCGLSIDIKELEYLNKKIKSKSPEAIMIHSVAHRYKVVLVQGLSYIPATRVFFATIQSMITDFKKAETGDSFLASILEDNTTSHSSEVYWTLDSNVMRFLLEERQGLIASSEERIADILTAKSMALLADQYLKNFKEPCFVFLLLVFHSLFKVTDKLFATLQKRSTDVMACSTGVKQAVEKLQQLKTPKAAQGFYEQAKLLITGCSCAPTNISNEFLAKLYMNVINNVIAQIKTRFSDIEKLEFLQLTDPKKFPNHDSKFPTDALMSLKNMYGKHFNFKQLKDELSIFIYSDKQFHVSAPRVVKEILKADLLIVLPESYKLFSLVATLPITPFRGETCFQRLNAYLERNKKLGTFTARIPLCMVMIQIPLLNRMEKDESWYDKIIDRFGKEKKQYNIDVICK